MAVSHLVALLLLLVGLGMHAPGAVTLPQGGWGGVERECIFDGGFKEGEGDQFFLRFCLGSLIRPSFYTLPLFIPLIDFTHPHVRKEAGKEQHDTAPEVVHADKRYSLHNNAAHAVQSADPPSIEELDLHRRGVQGREERRGEQEREREE